jgi:hypothetical protein
MTALDLDLPFPDISQRAAAFGTELRSIGPANLSTHQREIIERFQNAYSATARLTRAIKAASALEPADSRSNSLARTRNAEQKLPRTGSTSETLEKLRQEASRLLDQAHTRLRESDRE